MTTYQTTLDQQSVTSFRGSAKEKLNLSPKKHEAWKYFTTDEFMSSEYQLETRSKMSLSSTDSIKVTSLESFYSEHPESVNLGRDENPFSFSNTMLFKEGTVLTITGNSSEVYSVTLGENDHERLHINAKPQSSATVVLRIDSNFSFLNTFLSVELEEFSSLTVIVVSNSLQSSHIDHIDISQAGNSNCDVVFFDKDPKRTKRHLFHEFQGEHSKASFSGASLLSGSSRLSTQLWIYHDAMNCESKQLFKAILTDKALSEFSGLVSVKQGCHFIDSQQLNQNLLLSDNARVISRPQLRIDADDVQCAHGCTIGQLNPEEVFYIRSRGLSELEAKSLLTYGFIEEIVEKIEDVTLRKELDALVREGVNQYV